jgi:hypothetical protein
MLEFDAGVIGRELPIGFGVMGIAVSLPCGHLADEDLLVGDAASKTLRRAINLNCSQKQISEDDHQLYRLAALLHDIGHYPFSHAMEHVIHDHYSATLLKGSQAGADADGEAPGAGTLPADHRVRFRT